MIILERNAYFHIISHVHVFRICIDTILGFYLNIMSIVLTHHSISNKLSINTHHG